MKEETILKISYYWGAIADLLLGIEMLSCSILGNYSPFIGLGMTILGGDEFRYAISIAGVFTLVWTGILLWAAIEPRERKGILYLLIPVILGLRYSMFLALSLNLIPIANVIIDTVLSLVYLTVILLSLYRTRKSRVD